MVVQVTWYAPASLYGNDFHMREALLMSSEPSGMNRGICPGDPHFYAEACLWHVQVALRWAGDANIAIAIELPAGGEATRMVPKISDLHIQAVGRVLLAPLVGEIPGFGAAVISLR